MAVVMNELPDGVLAGPPDLTSAWACVHQDGSQRTTLEVREFAPDSFALRQSSRVSVEAPVLYLLVGAERALLLDTGDAKTAGECPVRPTVDALLAGRPVELVVAHTHGHYDHVRGDDQFVDRPRTTVVGKDIDSVRTHFGTAGQGHTVGYELGERTVLVTEIPGHDARSIAVTDTTCGFMITGDTAYPGRLYVDDLPAARSSFATMLDLARQHGVDRFLGCHLEIDVHGRQYPLFARFHHDEAPLQLCLDDMERAASTLDAASARGVTAGHPITVFVGTCARARLRLAARGFVDRARGRA